MFATPAQRAAIGRLTWLMRAPVSIDADLDAREADEWLVELADDLRTIGYTDAMLSASAPTTTPLFPAAVQERTA